MKVKDIIALNCRIDNDLEILSNTLKRLKPLSEYESISLIPTEKMEEYFARILQKYNLDLVQLKADLIAKKHGIIYIFCLESKQEQIKIFGESYKEALGKSLIYAHTLVKKGLINERVK